MELLIFPLEGAQKTKSKKINGCPIQSQAIGQEKLRTVFAFALAHLEGPPQAFAGYNSKFMVFLRPPNASDLALSSGYILNNLSKTFKFPLRIPTDPYKSPII